MLVNLLDETKELLKKYELNEKRIMYIYNAEGIIETARFMDLAANYNYDNENDIPNVDPTICVVGIYFWLTRGYDGKAEGWVFHKKPPKPTVECSDFQLKVNRNFRPLVYTTNGVITKN